MSEQDKVAAAAEAAMNADLVAKAELEKFLSPAVVTAPSGVLEPPVESNPSPSAAEPTEVVVLPEPPKEAAKSTTVAEDRSSLTGSQSIPMSRKKVAKKPATSSAPSQDGDTASEDLRPHGFRIMLRPGATHSFSTVPHVVESDRALAVLRFLLATEPGDALGKLHMAFTTWAETSKAREPGRITILLNSHAPDSPTMYVNKDGEAYFVPTLVAGRDLDIFKPMHIPVGEGGARAVLSVLRAAINQLTTDAEETAALRKYIDPKFAPCDIMLLAETLVVKGIADDDAMEERAMQGVTKAIPALEEERRALIGQQNLKVQELRQQLLSAAGADAQRVDPLNEDAAKKHPLAQEILKIAEKIGKIEKQIDDLRENIRQHMEKGYISRARDRPMDFFNPSLYQLVRPEGLGTIDLSRDTLFPAPGVPNETNPLVAVTHVAAMMAPEQVAIRVVYFGEVSWSDLLRPLAKADVKKRKLLDGKDQADFDALPEDQRAATLTQIDQARYSNEALYNRLTAGKRAALEHYKAEHARLAELNLAKEEKKKKKTEAGVASTPLTADGFGAEEVTAEVSDSGDSSSGEDYMVKLFPNLTPTVIHVAFPKALVADFFQSIRVMQSEHIIAMRQEMQKAVQVERSIAADARRPSSSPTS